ncbi:hypothetical protein AB0C84_45925 [Actinomadura sp. NPDC048955]|uniref:hypothetical protein n=1 Tax=Actinomadura sp. NPDC048955 TaxID=3158228 RepID=UPI0033F0D2B2
MTNQTASTAAASCPNQGQDEGTEYFVIITVMRPLPGGFSVKETQAYITLVEAGTTRLALLEQVNGEIPQRMRSGVIVFFSAEPNQIAPGEYAVSATLEQPLFGGATQVSSKTRGAQAQPGTRRADLYLWMRDLLADEGKAGSLVFFSAEPN